MHSRHESHGGSGIVNLRNSDARQIPRVSSVFPSYSFNLDILRLALTVSFPSLWEADLLYEKKAW